MTSEANFEDMLVIKGIKQGKKQMAEQIVDAMENIAEGYDSQFELDGQPTPGHWGMVTEIKKMFALKQESEVKSQ